MKNNFYINIISLNTIINKELTRIIRIWPQTILPQIVTTSLYFFIFGNLIGKKIGDMSSYTYMQYIIPGLIMMAIITSSYANVVSSLFGSKFQKYIEEIIISPTHDVIIIIGFITGGVIRSLIISIIILLISYIFLDFYIFDKKLIVLSFILTSLLFSSLGFINGLYAKRFDDISIVPTFVLTPLTYLGGIFYSINIIPEKIKILMYINPIFYITNIFRYSILGVSEINITNAFFFTIMLIIILFTVIFCLLKKGYEIKK